MPKIRNTSEFTTRPTLELKMGEEEEREERGHFGRFEEISFKQ